MDGRGARIRARPAYILVMKRRLMSLVLTLVAVLALAFAGFAVWVRLAPLNAADWHADPATLPDPATPNFARVDRFSPLPPEQVAASIVAQAQAEGAERLVGDAMFGTWVARSRLMGYPDYVTIRLTPEGDGTRIVAFSRARFGSGDAGVNRARLRRWLPE